MATFGDRQGRNSIPVMVIISGPRRQLENREQSQYRHNACKTPQSWKG